MQYVNRGFLSHRYLLITAALLTPLAAGGVRICARYSAWGTKWLPHRLPGRVWTTIWALGITAGLLAHSLGSLHEQKAYIREAGEYIGHVAGAGDVVVVVDRPRILHYSGLRNGVALELPRQKAEALTRYLAEARQRGVCAYVAFGDQAVAEADVSLRDYLASQAKPLREIATFTQDRKKDPEIICIWRADFGKGVLPATAPTSAEAAVP